MTALSSVHLKRIRSVCRRSGDSAVRPFEVCGTWFRIIPAPGATWILIARRGPKKGSAEKKLPLAARDEVSVVTAVELALCAEVLET